jgi:hypothetical protein
MDGHRALERARARLGRARPAREELAHVAGDRGGHDVARAEEARRRGVQEELAHADAARVADEPEVEELREAVVLARGELDAAAGRVLQELDVVLEDLLALVPAHGRLGIVGGDDRPLRLRADFVPVRDRDGARGVVTRLPVSARHWTGDECVYRCHRRPGRGLPWVVLLLRGEEG